MLFSNSCWMKNECNRYKQANCECKFSDIYCLKLYKLDYLYTQAGVPIALRKRLSLFCEDSGVDDNAFSMLANIQANMKTFISDGRNLYVHSSIPGNGKTSWALRLLQTYFNDIWAYSDLCCRALFINVPQLLIELKNNISRKSDYVQHIIDNIYTCDLVIWDDIGTKVGTEYELEHLYTFINGRINNGKANIYTSNLTNEQLTQAIGPRLVSRVCDLSIDVELKGFDKRGIKQ